MQGIVDLQRCDSWGAIAIINTTVYAFPHVIHRGTWISLPILSHPISLLDVCDGIN